MELKELASKLHDGTKRHHTMKDKKKWQSLTAKVALLAVAMDFVIENPMPTWFAMLTGATSMAMVIYLPSIVEKYGKE